ncbi:MAG: glutamate--tRNA ligase [Gemmatimonadota bacterium]
MKVRTRFAPSPTGELHLGNARIAALNWLVARRYDGAFILRFEDTDLERQVEDAERSILAGLDWLGLDRDEGPVRGGAHGPYRQSERLSLYREVADRWVDERRAYRCYCTPRELVARREAGGAAGYDGRCRDLSPAQEASLREEGRAPAVRFRVESGPITFQDRLRGEITVDAADFGDMVILRSDGRPTYNFAVVVDDLLMEITHVIRGAGHLANTPKQCLLYDALGETPPEFVHVPTVLAPGGGKLSKRERAPGLSQYREEGYHPEAVLNYLSLLSWSSPSGREVLSRADLIREIDLDRLGKSAPILDLEKMRWLSGQHVRRETPEALAERLTPFLPVEAYGLTRRDLTAFAELARPRIHLFTEAAEEARRLFAEPARVPTPPSERAAASTERLLADLAVRWAHLPEWTPEATRGEIRSAGEELRLGGAALYHPIRVALTGETQGPELGEMAYALGRERAVRRLRAAAGQAVEKGRDP